MLETTSRVWIAACVLVAFLLICMLSRMTMAESTLGGYARGQLLRTLGRIVKEGDMQAQISRQDADPLVAILHNAEATSNLRVAKHLAEETGLTQKLGVDFMDRLAELVSERDELIRLLMEDWA